MTLSIQAIFTSKTGKRINQVSNRLVGFSKEHQVSVLMGSHIEMTNKPGIAYPIGATYQPDETVLPLQLKDLYQLHSALEESGEKAKSMTFDHLII